MKILTVADFFYPEVVGGSAVVVYHIMKELARKGHEVTVLTRQQELQNYSGEIDGIQIHRYPFPRSQWGYPLALISTIKAIQSLLEEMPYDLINAHHASSGLAAAILKRYRSWPPYIFFFHGPWHGEAMAKEGILSGYGEPRSHLYPRYLIRKKIDRYILRHCTSAVVLSDYMYREALDIYPFLHQKYHKIPSGVDIVKFKPACDKLQVRRELGLPSDKVILLTVRRLSPRMGLENLVRAMVIIEEQIDDIMLVIGGRGDLWGKLNQLIASSGLKQTKLIGYIPQEELPKYYQASDLFIMPSVSLEGFGLATLEAMACGIPVLGTPVGGTPEILKEVLPEFILPGVEPEDLVNGILGKASVVRDPTLKVRVRQFAERFSWTKVADSVEELFQETVQGQN